VVEVRRTYGGVLFIDVLQPPVTGNLQPSSNHSGQPTTKTKNDKTTGKFQMKRKEKKNINRPQNNNTHHRKGVRKEETKNQVATMTFFPKMESSLQRAAAKSSTATKPVSQPTKKGAFESCFASGLDLSEFSSGGTQSQSSRPSAAAELLRVKQEEIKQKEREEEEETRMEVLVKNRVSQLEESIEKKKLGAHRSENMVVNALVNMHGNDDVVSKHKTRKAMKKTKSSSRPAPPQPQKSKAIKKSRRSKY
jgi:hypothetical protein